MKRPVHPLTYLGVIIIVLYLSHLGSRIADTVDGLLLTFGAGWTWLNRASIWKEYKKRYKKPKSKLRHTLHQPRQIFYTLNAWVALPLLFILGLAMIYTAWLV